MTAMIRMKPYSEQEVHRFFTISIWLKGIDSTLEVLAGIAIALIPLSLVTNALIALARAELIEDPGDLIANHILTFAHLFVANSQAFVAFYLISRGAVKLGLVVALLKEQLWAYPASLFVLTVFIAYQVLQIAETHSVFIVAITIFDFVVMYFIWLEYKILRKHLGKKPLAL